jgi:hypothetical protein
LSNLGSGTFLLEREIVIKIKNKNIVIIIKGEKMVPWLEYEISEKTSEEKKITTNK